MKSHRDELRLLGPFLDGEKSVDNKPVENRLDPLIVLGNRTVPNQGCELVHDPCASGVQSLNFRPKSDVRSLRNFAWRCYARPLTYVLASCSSLTCLSRYSI